MQREKLINILNGVAREYIPSMVDAQVQDIQRVAFHISLALENAGKDAAALSMCDLGGGLGLFSVGCGALGVQRIVLADDFSDPINYEVGDSVFALHRRYGVEIVSRDIVGQGLGGVDGDFDVVTTFDSMEHWHQSPKRLFRETMAALKPGGTFILGVPNCVNLRKRLTVPLGIGKWSGMDDWYEAEVFRGHVREPDVDDLRYIARDMGLIDVGILGRNWLGYGSASWAIRSVTRVFDRILRLRPSLCSDLYMIGRRPCGVA